MSEKHEVSFLHRVRSTLSDLPPAERQLGEFLCDFPGELASYNANELARLANVSNATVSRFVRSLGFDNYEQARILARKEGRTGSRLFLDHSEATADVNWPSDEVKLISDNLGRTFRRIDPQELREVARGVLAARRVVVIGFRSNFAFAAYLKWQLMQVVEDISLVPGGGETLGEHFAGLGTNDVVLVFGLRRRVAVTERLLASLVGSGAAVALVTDEGAEFRNDVKWHFRCETKSTGPIFNHTTVMALCHLLLSLAIEEAGATGRTRLQTIESLNEVFGEL
ncbi:MAG: MurR/RpiR family transcriptional regulator [Albidovulum sp.]|nr:MurR/RpiR family transcriptional regulator [Albidovulum sp.]